MPTALVRAQRRANGKCPTCGRDWGGTTNRCDFCLTKRRAVYEDKVLHGLCVADGCQREATHDKMCQEHREDMRLREQRKHKKIRDEAYAQYGGYRCACPGCTCTTPEFMQLDHINNDGGKHRREIGGCQQIGGNRILYWLKRHKWPKIVQPMCANCNFAKGHYGACPHANIVH